MLAEFRKVLLAAVTIATAPSTFADVITEWNNPADPFATKTPLTDRAVG